MAINAKLVPPASPANGPGGRPSGWLLALDTATDQAGIALFDGVRIAEVSWPAGRRQTVRLLPAIEGLLAACDISLDAVGAIGVAIGPGTFTGLRVGLSVAKGLAALSERAIIGVSTIAIAAEPYGSSGDPVLVTLPAGRGRVVWAVKEAGEEAGEPVNSSLEELAAVLADHPEFLLAGELLPDQREHLLAVHHHAAPITASARRPSSLARLAWERWLRGELDDPELIEPIYLHGQSGGR
ncbi:MAG TPA: tRNA (adenosine(37)-N6)-threonylcarbamoyltransferase complex dimerization subunit type 1 TsaB [Thermomicrobiales bacterium]|nr:tRNA (adenosine(37)-N6)-threonylcarbamoyltransferase complex dimerization subunit type 1 TsaB [Thermomicrobiales bacterium]